METTLIWTMLLAGIMAQQAGASIITDGSFEGLVEVSHANGGNGYFQEVNPGALGAWTIKAGNVAVVKNTLWQATDGSFSIGLQGVSASATIEQELNTVAGQTYQLSFDRSGSPDLRYVKTLQVSVGDTLKSYNFDPTQISAYADMKYVHETLTFKATTAHTLLSFSDMSNGGVGSAGSVLDNVKVSAVPKPSTIIAGALALLLFPFGISAFRSLRKNKA